MPGVFAGRREAAEYRENPLAVVTADEVERTKEGFGRVVLLQALHFADKHFRTFLADDVVDGVVAERVVHNAVQLVAGEVTAQGRVTVFV